MAVFSEHNIDTFGRCVCAGLLLVAGVAIADTDTDHIDADPFASTLEITGALCAIVSAVFLILTLVCGGGAKTSPS